MRSKQHASNQAYGLLCFEKMLIFICSRYPVSLSPSKDDFNDIITFHRHHTVLCGTRARQEPPDWPYSCDSQCPPIYSRGAHPGDPKESDGVCYKGSIISTTRSIPSIDISLSCRVCCISPCRRGCDVFATVHS